MTEPSKGVALITGAGRRIGRAMALDLADAGWDIAVHCHHSTADAEEVADAVVNAGRRSVIVEADLQNEEAVEALVPRSADALGPVTCLINNASVFEADTVADATRESWDQHLSVNLRAPFVLTQAFAHGLNGKPGNIINILDQRVWNLTPYFASYTISKAALWTLTQTSAMALAPAIRVNAVGPGPTLPSPRQTEQQFNDQWAGTPLKRPVDPMEIAAAVRFILASSSMTGQMIALDAGQHLGWSTPNSGQAEEE